MPNLEEVGAPLPTPVPTLCDSWMELLQKKQNVQPFPSPKPDAAYRVSRIAAAFVSGCRAVRAPGHLHPRSWARHHASGLGDFSLIPPEERGPQKLKLLVTSALLLVTRSYYSNNGITIRTWTVLSGCPGWTPLSSVVQPGHPSDSAGNS